MSDNPGSYDRYHYPPYADDPGQQAYQAGGDIPVQAHGSVEDFETLLDQYGSHQQAQSSDAPWPSHNRYQEAPSYGYQDSNVASETSSQHLGGTGYPLGFTPDYQYGGGVSARARQGTAHSLHSASVVSGEEGPAFNVEHSYGNQIPQSLGFAGAIQPNFYDPYAAGAQSALSDTASSAAEEHNLDFISHADTHAPTIPGGYVHSSFGSNNIPSREAFSNMGGQFDETPRQLLSVPSSARSAGPSFQRPGTEEPTKSLAGPISRTRGTSKRETDQGFLLKESTRERRMRELLGLERQRSQLIESIKPASEELVTLEVVRSGKMSSLSKRLRDEMTRKPVKPHNLIGRRLENRYTEVEAIISQLESDQKDLEAAIRRHQVEQAHQAAADRTSHPRLGSTTDNSDAETLPPQVDLSVYPGSQGGQYGLAPPGDGSQLGTIHWPDGSTQLTEVPVETNPHVNVVGLEYPAYRYAPNELVQPSQAVTPSHPYRTYGHGRRHTGYLTVPTQSVAHAGPSVLGAPSDYGATDVADGAAPVHSEDDEDDDEPHLTYDQVQAHQKEYSHACESFFEARDLRDQFQHALDVDSSLQRADTPVRPTSRLPQTKSITRFTRPETITNRISKLTAMTRRFEADLKELSQEAHKRIIPSTEHSHEHYHADQ